MPYKSIGSPLYRITPRLSPPLVGYEIALDIFARQPFEANASVADAQQPLPARRDQAHRRIDPMRATRQKPQAIRCVLRLLGLGQKPATDRDGRVGRENEDIAPELTYLMRV